MKILVICTACIKDRDIQYDLYDYWANTGGNDVMVVAPQQADVTKGGTLALREEKVGRLDIRRLYRDIPEMWNKQEKALEELVPLVQRFRPEVIWCWHENNYPLAACLAKLFTPTIPVIPYLEIPSQDMMNTAWLDSLPFVLSCVLTDKYREEEFSRGATNFLKMEISVDIEHPEQYASPQRLNRGIFCGSLGYYYKGPEVFDAFLPRLFDETPMERFLMISPGNEVAKRIVDKYAGRYPLDYVESMGRNELFREIGKSFFAFTSTTVESPGSFPIECLTLQTPVFSAGSSLGEVIVDGVTGIRTIETLNRLYRDPESYRTIQTGGFQFYRQWFSTQSVGERCLKIFRGIIEGRGREVWEELRYKGPKPVCSTPAAMAPVKPCPAPSRPLRVGIQLPVINTFNGAVWGDEVMAVGIAERLVEQPGIAFAEVYDTVTIHDALDVVLDMYPVPQMRYIAGAKRYWWYQAEVQKAALELPNWRDILKLYEGFFAASPQLARQLISWGVPAEKIGMMPMSCDMEFYSPRAPDPRYAHDLVFCGNAGPRKAEEVERYLLPLKQLGLVIYGAGWEKFPAVSDCARGPIPPADVPILYSSAKVVISTHTTWHRENNLPTSRFWETLACNAVLVSDRVPYAEELFGDAVVWTDGGTDIREKVAALLADDTARLKLKGKGRRLLESGMNFRAYAPVLADIFKGNGMRDVYAAPKQQASAPAVTRPEPHQPAGVTTAAAPLVSVIVPTYNRPDALGKALDSILAQSFRDFEIIVVNDCGQGVEQVIAARGAQAPITYIRHGVNRERSATRNTGLKAARGKYIAYLDDDDLFYPNHLETLVNYLQNNKAQVAYTDANRAWQIVRGGEYVTAKRDLPYSHDFDYDMVLVTNFIPILCVMHEKACLDKVGLFDESLATHEDWELWIRMSRAFAFHHIPKATCEFSWRDDGTTTTSSRRHDFARTVKLIYDRYRTEAETKPNVMAGRDKVISVWDAELGSDSISSSAIKEDADMMPTQNEGAPNTPTSVRAEEFKRLGTEAKTAKNHEEAFRCFSQAREAGDRSVTSDMGDCLARLGKIDDALVLYDEAIRENPGDPRPLLGKGVIKIIKNDGKEAALLFSSVLKQNETVVKALSGMGMARQLEGKTSEAIICYKLALEADPEEPAALSELVRCSYDLNCPEDAEPYLVKYLMYHPTDPDMLFTLAGNLFHQGKFTDAKDHLERLLLINPEYQDGAALLAKTREGLARNGTPQANLSVAR